MEGLFKRTAVSALAIIAGMTAGLSPNGAEAAQPGSADGVVSFQDVLKNPTDISLNMRFAQERMAAGDLLAAAAAMERLLFYEPNWDEARVLYAGILYRLGDFAAAKRETALLEKRDLTPEARSLVNRYDARINAASKPTRVGGYLSLGAGYDENASTLIAEDNIDPEISETEQYSFVARGRLTVERDLSQTRDRELFAVLDGFTKQFDDQDTIDGYSILKAKAGLKGSTDRYGWRVNTSGRHVNIGGDSYLNELGVEARLTHQLTGKTSLAIQVGAHDQSYDQVFGPQDTSDLRSGPRYDVSVSAKHRLSSRVALSARGHYRHKGVDEDDNAIAENFAYDVFGVELGGNLFLSRGVYVDGDVLYRDFSYDGDQGREDEYAYGRVAVGVPVSTLVRQAGGTVADRLILEAAVYHLDRGSNIDVFEYESTGAEARVVWRFGQ